MKKHLIRHKNKRIHILTILLCFIYSASSINAASKEYLKYGLIQDISSISGKINLFRDIKAKPLASLEMHKLTSQRGKETKTFQSYFPEELWLHDQHAGTWINNICTVSVYKMRLPVPEKIPTLLKKGQQTFVSKEAYNTWKTEVESEKTEWSDEKIVTWLQYLTKLKFQLPPETLKRGGAKKSTTKCFKPESGSDNDIIYVITNSYTPEEPVVLRYQLKPAEDREHQKNIKAVATSLATMTFYKPKKNTTNSKEKVFSSYKYKKKNIERSPEYIASRDVVKKSIQNLPDWWFLETDNFVMVSNIKNQKTILDLSKNLENSRNVFTQYYPVETPLKAVSVARMFESRDEYVNFVGEEHKWSGGIWMSSKKELVVSPMNWGSRTEQRKMMIKTTFHEAFHQYIYFATGEKHTASWFNEGNAQFFEEIDFRGTKFSIEINEREAKNMLRYTSLEDINHIINVSHSNFYKSSDRSKNYTLSWGLMFFLQKGAPIMKEKNNYHEIPMKYYRAILTNNAEKANRIAWEGVDMELFADDFKKFWESSSLIKRADRYDPLKK